MRAVQRSGDQFPPLVQACTIESVLSLYNDEYERKYECRPFHTHQGLGDGATVVAKLPRNLLEFPNNRRSAARELLRSFAEFSLVNFELVVHPDKSQCAFPGDKLALQAYVLDLRTGSVDVDGVIHI